jgi:hypothetical protein
LLGEESGKRDGEERRVEEREMRNILVVYEFAEELQCSARLLSTVAPHHFAELDVEPAGECILWFGKGLFVEPTVNALNFAIFSKNTVLINHKRISHSIHTILLKCILNTPWNNFFSF